MFRKVICSFFKNNPKIIWELRSLRRQHKFINFSCPGNFYEYIAYSSVYFDKRWISLTDKYEVRLKVKSIIGDSYLNELYDVCDDVSELDIDKYPQSFVVKTTNGCATNLIIKDKDAENWTELKAKLKKWLKYPYGELTGQPHYSYIKPRIIVEKYMEESGKSSLTDYKFFCINGEPFIVYVHANRKKNSHLYTIGAYDMDWVSQPSFLAENYPHFDSEKPKSFELMKELVRKLAHGFKFVRVDLYEIDGKPIFGEYTFTPGFDAFSELAMHELFNRIVKFRK